MSYSESGEQQRPTSGSSKVAWIQEQFDNRTFDWKALTPIRRLAERSDVELISFWVRGQPHPDRLGGTFRVQNSDGVDDYRRLAGEIVTQLLAADELQLKLSIDSWPDPGVDVHFSGPYMSYPGGQPAPVKSPDRR
jgi:hypothetical protein